MLRIVAADGTDRPMARPGDVKLPEYERRIFRHMIPADVDWVECLDPAYWTAAEVLKKLTPGDRLEVFTSDYSLGFELLVVEIVPLAEYLRVLARPLFPSDLVLPAPAEAEEPRYFMRQGLDRQWEVIDRISGKVVKARIGRGAADEECLLRNTADRDAKALVAAREARAAAGEPGDSPHASSPVPEVAPEAVTELAPEGLVTGPTAVPEAAAVAVAGDNAAAVAAPVVVEGEQPADTQELSVDEIDALDDLTGLPRPRESVAEELAALGRASGLAAEQPQPKETA